MWFIDAYIKIKDKLWIDWIKENSLTMKMLREENENLQGENIKLKNEINRLEQKNKLKEDHIELQYIKEINRLEQTNKLKEEHIELQYHKENNRLIRQSRDILFKQNKISGKKKNPYPRKNCWKCRGSVGGICVEHGG